MAFITFQAEECIVNLIDDIAKKIGGCSRAAFVRAAVAYYLNEKLAKPTGAANLANKEGRRGRR